MSDIRQELVYDLYEAGHSDESANALLDSFADEARAEGAAAVSAAVGDLWDRETNKGLAFVSPRIVPELRAALDTDDARRHDVNTLDDPWFPRHKRGGAE